MNPSHVRIRILQDHAALRLDLDRLEASVGAMREDRSQFERMIAIARHISSALVAHTQLEDSILVPALRELDAWGAVRASLLLNHHSEQRAQVRELIDSYETPGDPDRIARLTLAWIQDVRMDMSHEESDVLSAALLKDDPISVAMESG